MANPFVPKAQTTAASVGLLALRLAVGIALCFHGWGKVTADAGMTAWMPAGMGNALPEWAQAGWAQAFAALAEFVGGIALAAGVLTPLATLAIAANMAMATWFHLSQGAPLVAKQGGPSFELPLAYFTAALCVLLCGPGKASLDAMMFKRA